MQLEYCDNKELLDDLQSTFYQLLHAYEDSNKEQMVKRKNRL